MDGRKRLNAIIVEDNHVSRALLRGLLRAEEVEVTGEATNAERARALLVHGNPDLVCLDILLPDGSGIDLLRAIKADRPGVKVLMVSGATDIPHVRDALENGADGFVVKPYSSGTLLAALERLFGARKPA
jgi:two-component system chemotaxis response regulator CheY